MGSGAPRIVLANNSCQYVWYFRGSLIAALRRSGYEVVILAPRDEFTSRLVSLGVAYREIRLDAKGRNPIREIGTVAAFIRAYRELRPAVILHFTIKPNLYGSIGARLVGIPAIDNVTGLGAAFERRGPLQSMVRLMYRAAFARVEKVFFQNADDRAAFVRGRLVDATRADLLPGSGVDLERFAPRPRGQGPFTFLFVGRLLKAKGVEDLVHASRVVAGQRKGIRIVLAGERPVSEAGAADPCLLREAEADGSVQLAGVVDDVRPLIAEADCVVLPSYYREGVPRSLLEAAAMGKPLIAADSIGTREPVVDGRNGFLCRPRDPVDLAAKMLRMAGSSETEREAMGTASRRIAEQRFDEKIVIGRYLETIDALRRKG
jgi:glycosyltransferase involved in cell wall biosynthesis